jgi:hypothetical protein
MRAFALAIAQLQAHRFDGQQQIGENDGRVHVQRFHRLQRDGGGQIGPLADLEQRFGADVAVRFM